VLGLIALLLVAWAGHAGWHAWRTHDVENRALAWIRGDPGLAPLPLGVAFASRENRLAAEGVVPDVESRDRLAQGLRRIAPADARIELRVAALGAAGGEAGRTAAEEIAALERRLDALPEPDYLTMIAGWLARHPIRFADGDAYRDEELARQKLGAVAQLIEAWPLEFGVRVVGYSDADGSARANLASSAARAERVVADLVALGVPRDRLSAVGRGADKPVAPGTGPESGNRRVELELYLSH
jgi:OmpA-OmpF porin, OOP family